MRNACEVLNLESDDTYPLQVVGESHYQEELQRVSGPRGKDGAWKELTVSLQLENSPYDPEAVRVEVDNRCVGYLTRPDARAYRKVLEKAGTAEELCCRGQIRGGWDRGENDRGNYGIWGTATV